MKDHKDKNKRAKDYLYNYPSWISLIKTLEDDIINSSQDVDEGMPRGSDLGNSTEAKAFTLMDDDELQSIKEKVSKVDSFLRVIELENQIYKEIVELKYFDRALKDDDIYTKLHISRRTFYRYNKEILRIASILL